MSRESTTDFCEKVLSGLERNSLTREEKSSVRSVASMSAQILSLITARTCARVAFSNATKFLNSSPAALTKGRSLVGSTPANSALSFSAGKLAL